MGFMVHGQKTINAPGGSESPFPIVGIGASAGGLGSFEDFFTAMPEDPGMAFILVSHLSPDHISMLPDLIQEKTSMNVHQVTDNLKVEANHVYIIPPNKEMAISDGVLYLKKQVRDQGVNLPIDGFFCSLAKDRGSGGACIILSGTGSDGTLGLKSMKEAGGMVMVEDEKSAQFTEMPHSARATGHADYILPPAEMPQTLIRYFAFARKPLRETLWADSKENAPLFQKILSLLFTTTGHNFSLYKKNTLCRRIDRRMQVYQIEALSEYVRLLEQSQLERKVLFFELLIGVTSFFRDPEAYKQLQQTFLLNLFMARSDGDSFRVWVPGCSTGEEVYSLAIVLYEAMMESHRHFKIQIFGTDIDERALTTARAGIYPSSISSDVSPSRLQSFFDRENHSYKICKRIRQMIIFAPQNVVQDPPFTRLDLISCRNLLIYFGSELQKRLLPIFHYSLNGDGILFLGSSETIGNSGHLFQVLDKKWKLFTPVASTLSALSPLQFPASQLKNPTTADEKEDYMSSSQNEKTSALHLVESILAQSALSPCAVIDEQANILYIHGRTGQFLEPAEGVASTNILQMARSGLTVSLANAITKTAKNRQETVVEGLRVETGTGFLNVKLTVRLMTDFETGCRGMMMVIFEAVAPDVNERDQKNDKLQGKKSDQVRHLENELRYTREILETANEELKSTNEELQSTNEELQSTNEELETSKEELQSLNEESITVNQELQCRIDEVVKANNDLKNLLDATNIATIFLDTDLAVKGFTPRATDLFPLTLNDMGRPIRHFATKLSDVDIAACSAAVLEDLQGKEAEVVDTDNECYRMRIHPYRTTNNVIEGVVITFENVTNIKNIEAQLKEGASAFEDRMLMMEQVFLDSPDAIVIEDSRGIVVEVNEEALGLYGFSREELVGKSSLNLVPEGSREELSCLFLRCRNGEKIRNVEQVRLNKAGKITPVYLTLSLLSRNNGEADPIASIVRIPERN